MTTEAGGVVGATSELNALEAMMWRAEVDPRLRSPVTIVDVLDVEPDWDRLVAAHDWATRFVPRLRERVLEPWWGPPEWVPDPDFSLGFHLRLQRLTEPGGMRELVDLAALLAMEPFDRSRPLWEAVVVSGLEGGGAGYLLKVHHSLADGLGLLQILSMLHSPQREHVEGRPDYPTPSRESPSSLALTASSTARRVRDAPSTILGGLRAGAGLLRRTITDPVTTITDGSAYVWSAMRAAVPPTVPGSPLLRARSLNRRFDTVDVDLQELKSASRAAGGSLNDAFLAALLGALRAYHRRFGEVPERIPMGMPVNTRDPSDPVGGNHWAGTRFAVPLGEADPASRIREVREIVRTITGEPAVDALGLIAPLLAALPAPLLARIQGGTTSANDVQASNVPGMSARSYLAGAEIVRSYPFAPLPGGAAMITLTSHRGTCCIAVNLDPAAITEPETFLEDLHGSFAEILALAEPR